VVALLDEVVLVLPNETVGKVVAVVPNVTAGKAVDVDVAENEKAAMLLEAGLELPTDGVDVDVDAMEAAEAEVEAVLISPKVTVLTSVEVDFVLSVVAVVVAVEVEVVKLVGNPPKVIEGEAISESFDSTGFVSGAVVAIIKGSRLSFTSLLLKL